jgi:tripartite ATP-independent transporter DctM subunit
VTLSNEAIGVLGLAALVALILARVPAGVALGLAGFFGYVGIEGWSKAFVALGTTPLDIARNYSFTVLPLFILMGCVAAKTNMAREMFDAINTIFSGLRGSLAVASVVTCAGFGAISGSSLATAATISRIAVPEMQRHGYDIRIATGTVASAGTLGILIPPSIIMVVYAIIAEESVPALFAAGFLPGLLLAVMHIVAIMIMGWARPDLLPIARSTTALLRVFAVKGLWKLALLFTLAVGGIYLGWFSPTEAAAVGAFCAFLIAAATRQLTRTVLIDSFTETIRTSAALFIVILGGFMFGYFMVFSRIPAALGSWLEASNFSVYSIIALIVVIYIIFGLFLDSISMMLITVPVFLPIIRSFGLDPVWFGIFIVVVAEIGLITPPVGLNVFVIKSQLPEIPIQTIYAGILPFLVVDLLLIVFLVAFPELALWLPRIIV